MDLSWDLTQVYKNYDEYDRDFSLLKELLNEKLKFKGKLHTKEAVLKYFQLSDEQEIITGRLVYFLEFKKSLDGSDVVALEKFEEIVNFLQEYAKKFTFATDEIKKVPNKTLLMWAKEPEFSDYDIALEELVKSKKHMLSQDKEKLMIDASSYANFRDIFDSLDNVELKFGKIKDEEGKFVTLTHSNYAKLSSSYDRTVRKNAVRKMIGAYKAVNQTLAFNYISHLKYTNFVAKTYKYKSVLDQVLEEESLPKDLPRKVAKNINKFLPNLHRYYAWRKNFMKLDKFETVDTVCDLFDKSVVKTYSLEECQKILKQAFAVLGQDYINVFEEAINNNWVDSRCLPNKQSGAFSSDIYAVHPFMLLSYDGTADAVSTFAHEFGHCMHTYYSQKYQPYSKWNYEIFVAEVASLTNEILLSNYFISGADSKQEKITHITNFLDIFVSNVFGATQYSEFELYVHDQINQNQPLTYKSLNEFYYKLQKKYYGKNVFVPQDRKYNWSRIQHFYRDFYLFKYSTSFIAACAVASKLLADKDYNKTYKKLLSAGASKKPCEILQDAGVDILNEVTYKNAFDMFDNYVKQLEELA